jgi:dTDP-4-dehydrorhamnose reductase
MSMTRSILVTGGDGQLGTSLLRLPVLDGYELVAPGLDVLDFTRPETIDAVMGSRPWAAVINGAAHTAVDRAESEPALAWTINAAAPARIARHCAATGIPMVQVSTDYVYPGDKNGAYVETDAIGPLGVYGASKAAGEVAVAAAVPRHVIARTSWVVSPYGANFVKTMLRLGQERNELRVVDDQWGAPTSAPDLAQALLTIVQRLIEDPDAPVGAFHVVNRGETTWRRVAEAVFAKAAQYGRPVPKVIPIPTSEYPTPVRRPLNSRLSTDRLEQMYGIVLPDWRASVERIVEQLLQAETSV